MSIIFSSQFDRLTEYNSSFDKGVLRVCYAGKNRNNSYIGKETFERCIQTIYNCPIVCRYDRELDEIGSHDMELVTGSDGKMRLVNITHPVGVIPESANYWWENIEEGSGAIHEYLCVEALLWKRQEAYQKIKDDGISDESMEINIVEGRMKDGVYVIDKFEFTAFCLLGTARPCYESASLMTFSESDFESSLHEMMKDFKESLSGVGKPGTYSEFSLEGGNVALEEKKALMTQYGLTEEMLGFNLDDFSIEELTAKFEEMKADPAAEPPVEPPVEEPVSDPVAEPTTDPVVESQFALAEQFKEELIEALGAEKIDSCFGEMSRYWYVDYDAGVSEVYCYDQNDWKLYGFAYSMNGDHVSVDFDSKKRKKFTIADFDEGEQTAAFAGVFAMLSERFATKDNEWAEKYQSAVDSASQMESELNELRSFKADVEKAESDKEKEELFSAFEDLVGVEAFEALRDDCEKFSLEEIEEKCFAIRGRKQTGKFALSSGKAPKLPIDKAGVGEDEPYGGVFAKYGIRR